jgi:hypothetical protein
VLGRREDGPGTTPPPVAGPANSDPSTRDEHVDFEVVEETDVLKGAGPRSVLVPDDADTRPGPK